MKKKALFSALTSKLKNKEVLVIKNLEKVKPRTKEMAETLEKLTRSKKDETRRTKLTIVLPKVLENVIRAGRNIPNLRLIQARQLNTYEVLNGGKLVFMEESIGVVKGTFLSKTNKKPTTAEGRNHSGAKAQRI